MCGGPRLGCWDRVTDGRTVLSPQAVKGSCQLEQLATAETTQLHVRIERQGRDRLLGGRGAEASSLLKVREGAVEGTVGVKVLLGLEMGDQRIRGGVGCGVHVRLAPAQV